MNQPVNFSAEGPPETVLPAEDPSVAAALAAAESDEQALSEVVAAHPTSLMAWSALAAQIEARADDIAGVVAAYAVYRVGYHRGLDALRKNGWRGSGFVRWQHESNRGFLRCLDGLGRMAARIDERGEHHRVQEFLHQLDPSWPPDGA